MSRVAFATCLELPEPDVDQDLLMAAVAAAGVDASLVAWDDASVDWSQFQLVILRSTWDYYEREERFREWIRSVSNVTRLLNPASLILRTIEKTYLAEMERAGVPVVPTRFPSKGKDLAALLDEAGWTDFVIKPTVSAGSFMTMRFSREQAEGAARFRDELERTHRTIVQKFMPRVEDGGEVSLVHIDGELTHGIVKRPRFLGGFEDVSQAIVPTDEHAAAARRVLSLVPEQWLYARVDLMADQDGSWLLSELEVIEPSLFFLQHPPALTRFVQAVSRLTNPDYPSVVHGSAFSKTPPRGNERSESG